MSTTTFLQIGTLVCCQVRRWRGGEEEEGEHEAEAEGRGAARARAERRCSGGSGGGPPRGRSGVSANTGGDAGTEIVALYSRV